MTFDLTGLPPTPEEVDAFVAESNRPGHRPSTNLLDRLLACPHYGERWGRHWLDVARYSDTKGYVYAREERFFVHAWTYRDWVIKAFNDDLPYDRFLLLQLAADQLVPAGAPDLAAMGFLTVAGASSASRTTSSTTASTWSCAARMALTVACARCHDHKYDPIPTRDYYSLYGVFGACEEKLVSLGAESADAEYREAREETRRHDEEAPRRSDGAVARARGRLPRGAIRIAEISRGRLRSNPPAGGSHSLIGPALARFSAPDTKIPSIRSSRRGTYSRICRRRIFAAKAAAALEQLRSEHGAELNPAGRRAHLPSRRRRSAKQRNVTANSSPKLTNSATRRLRMPRRLRSFNSSTIPARQPRCRTPGSSTTSSFSPPPRARNCGSCKAKWIAG